MLNTEMIKAKYSAMLDIQLIAVAQKDAAGLMPEAFQLLKQEFAKRNLDYSYIEAAEENKALIEQEKIQKIRDSNDEEFSKATWKYVLEEKLDGTADNKILAGLQERGLDEQHSQLLLLGLEDKIEEMIDSYDTKMLIGGASFILGIGNLLLRHEIGWSLYCCMGSNCFWSDQIFYRAL